MGSIVHQRWILGPYEEAPTRINIVKVGMYYAMKRCLKIDCLFVSCISCERLRFRIEGGMQFMGISRQVPCPCKFFTLYEVGQTLLYLNDIV